jgi:hypothetical protein
MRIGDPKNSDSRYYFIVIRGASTPPKVTMRTAILSTALLASFIAWTGCGSSGVDGGGGTGPTGGSGGSAMALSLDADTALPATGGAAVAVAFTTGFGYTVSSILEAIAFISQAAAAGLVPKAAFDFSGFCASGAATLDAPSWPPETWVPPTDIVLSLAECEGSVLAAGPVSGSITWSIESVSDDPVSGPTIEGATDVMLLISTSPDTRTEVTGAFEVLAQVSAGFVNPDGTAGNGRIMLRLGAQLDDDLITVSEVVQDAGQALRFGCFDIDLFLSGLEPDQIAPLSALELAGQVYTMNDYAQMPSLIVLDEEGVPSSGELTLSSGDRSDAGEDRTEPCFDAFEGDTSTATATFFGGGCLELNGVDAEGDPFSSSSTWDKLLAGDFSEGFDGACGGGMPCGEVPAGAFVIADSEFRDSDWEAEAVSTPGAVFEWPIVRETSGGLGNSPYRNMTHSIENATNCDVSCTLAVFHKSVAATYNPSEQGAINYIDYTEAQRILIPSFEGGAVGWGFAVMQNGRRYNLFREVSEFTNLNWETNGFCNLTEGDFGPPGNQPDFSAAGAEITFGYIRSNTNTSDTSTSTSVHGIDDFKVVIVGE